MTEIICALVAGQSMPEGVPASGTQQPYRDAATERPIVTRERCAPPIRIHRGAHHPAAARPGAPKQQQGPCPQQPSHYDLNLLGALAVHFQSHLRLLNGGPCMINTRPRVHFRGTITIAALFLF